MNAIQRALAGFVIGVVVGVLAFLAGVVWLDVAFSENGSMPSDLILTSLLWSGTACAAIGASIGFKSNSVWDQ